MSGIYEHTCPTCDGTGKVRVVSWVRWHHEGESIVAKDEDDIPQAVVTGYDALCRGKRSQHITQARAIDWCEARLREHGYEVHR